MTVKQMILREIRHRRVNAALAFGGIAAAVGLFVVLYSEGRDVQRETRRITRDMGFNLRIIPASTDMVRFWIDGYSQDTLPEDSVHALARTKGLSYNHLIAQLIGAIKLDGHTFLLTGISDELSPPGKKKPPMQRVVPPGSLTLGFEAARHLGAGKGETVVILGRRFTVAETLGEAGTADDVRIWGALEDVQALLDLKGRISEIKAIDCLCTLPENDPLTPLRAQLAELLPEARLVQQRLIADARARQRTLMRDQQAFLLPVVIIACAVWIAVLATLNVRQRHEEIGALRALGWASSRIAGLFLGKAVVLGTLGAAVGVAAGAGVAIWMGPDIFPSKATGRIDPVLVGGPLILAPLLAAAASLVPAMLAVTQDPAVTLRGDA
ncbi:MAG: hypothetical protein CMJ83_12990 [Planctomycetes bacterium]|nr:hypothetical protein [Planctomycetota bacterium]